MGINTMTEYMKSFAKRGYIFMKTQDEWYPNFPKDMVAVSPVMKLHGKPTMYRVCVWGMDDSGMEIDTPSKKDAERIRAAIKSPVTRFQLKNLGMYQA